MTSKEINDLINPIIKDKLTQLYYFDNDRNDYRLFNVII
jgi:hypothetical protein